MLEGASVDVLDQAIQLAAAAHTGQLDRVGDLYILHPLRVMESVSPDLDRMIVAVLHDVIEDTAIGGDDLSSIDIPDQIVAAVQLLTRPKCMAYWAYIERICAARGDVGAVVRAVKLADIRDNLRADRMARLPISDRLRLEGRYGDALAQVQYDMTAYGER